MADRMNKFFKNKISREEIPFDEELWMQASAGLDARKRQRRPDFLDPSNWSWIGGDIILEFTVLIIQNGNDSIESNEVARNQIESDDI
ncbi:MAG: hypothetical protein R2784_11220 [Saprospiraceae bacterium]